jgi:hypothetical protein
MRSQNGDQWVRGSPRVASPRDPVSLSARAETIKKRIILELNCIAYVIVSSAFLVRLYHQGLAVNSEDSTATYIPSLSHSPLTHVRSFPGGL